MLRKIILKGFLVFLILLLVNPISISAGAPDLRYIENPDLKGEVIEFKPPKKKPPNATPVGVLAYLGSEVASRTEVGRATEEYVVNTVNDYDMYLYDRTQTFTSNYFDLLETAYNFTLESHESLVNITTQQLQSLVDFVRVSSNEVIDPLDSLISFDVSTQTLTVSSPYSFQAYNVSSDRFSWIPRSTITITTDGDRSRIGRFGTSSATQFSLHAPNYFISSSSVAFDYINSQNKYFANDPTMRVYIIDRNNDDLAIPENLLFTPVDLNHLARPVNKMPSTRTIEQSETIPDIVEVNEEDYWRTHLPNPDFDESLPISPNNPETIPHLVPTYVPEGQPIPEPIPQYVPNPNYDSGTNPDPESNPEPVYIPNPNYNPDSPPSAENPTYVPNPNYVPEVTPIPEGDPTAVPDFDPITGIGTPPMPDVSIEPLIGFSGMTEKFPFSIPWDIYRIFNYFNVQPQAPLYEVDIPEFINIGDKSIPMRFDIDFSVFEPIAAVIRWGLIIAFDISLILMLRRITPD